MIKSLPWLLMVALASCTSPIKENSAVSDGLVRRTGHGLRGGKPGETIIPKGASVFSLTENGAVSIALANNAAFLETLSDLGIARADVISAGQLTNPSFSMLFPSGPKQLEFTAKFPLEALWLRPKRVATAKLDYEKTAQLLVQNGLDLIRDVKLAYADLSFAEQRQALAEESQKLNAQIEQLATARVKAGEASELEVSMTSVDFLQATEQVQRARHDVTAARARLRNLLGLGVTEENIRLSGKASSNFVPAKVGSLVKKALASRPDLRAAELAVEAAGKRVGLAQAEIFTITGMLDANGSGSGFESGPGIDLALPIFHQNQGGTARARSQLEKASRHYIAVRDRIILDVREAHVKCLQARQSYETWNTRILPPLEQAINQSQKAYEAGNVPLLLVLEANRKLTEARSKRAEAATSLRRAHAELERSVGGNL